jgi:uncharacterized protein (TIGR04222 family)
MIPQEYISLWQRISDFQLDDSDALINFSRKLSSHKGWTTDYTQKAIAEYRKFIFLCCVVPVGASPSPVVDEVWHLHLTYTDNYWNGLCKRVLGRDLHHYPSKGGEEEKQKHIDWYYRTYTAYLSYFDSLPPGDIWPDPVPTTVKSAGIGAGGWESTRFIFFFLPVIIPLLFYRVPSPFQLTGPQFLVFYSAVILGFILFLVYTYRIRYKELSIACNEIGLGTKNMYSVVRFVYGRNWMLQTAIVDLVAKGLLVPLKHERFQVKKLPDHGESNPLAVQFGKYYNLGDEISLAELSLNSSNEDTYDATLSSVYLSASKKDVGSWVLFIGIIILGLARMWQGKSNDQPVSILLTMIVVFVLGGLVALGTTRGRDILRRIIKHKYKYAEFDLSSQPVSSVATDFAFLGMVAISGMAWSDQLQSTFRDHFKKMDGEASISTGGCGSSGCGGNCAGGGCGGCGGGGD